MDPKRPEILTEAADDKPEILVQAWYPAAKPGRNPGPYLPDFKSLASSTAADSLSNLFGPSWPSISSNELRTHSFDNVPVSTGRRLPILIFSPGGGVPVVAYTSQIEGAMERARRQSADTESFEKNLTDMRAADLRFVVDQLGGLENDPKSVFHARLDLGRIGVFGHSRGGRSAARVCQIDDRIKACLNQDGSWSWHPFWLDKDGRSQKQPFMMLDHFDPDPPEEAFSKMGTTRERYVGRRMARQAEAREKCVC